MGTIHDSASAGWLVTSIEEVNSLGLQAVAAANRALSAAELGAMDCAYARRAEAKLAL